jgi:outer membrane receptor protein involved in Fe transport
MAVQNLFDKKYIGSVAVNAAGATVAATKFYEPAPRRTFYVGVNFASSPW